MIDLNKTAFLLLHWQNDLVTPKGNAAGDLPKLIAAAHNVEHTQDALKANREKGVFVIHVNLRFRPGYPEFPADIGGIPAHIKETKPFFEGSWGAKPFDQLKRLENEPLVLNSFTDAFCYTDLELLLRNKGIRKLVITGIYTDFVVETTAREAVGRGFSVIILEDCCNSFDREMHDWAIEKVLPSFATILSAKAYVQDLGDH